MSSEWCFITFFWQAARWTKFFCLNCLLPGWGIQLSIALFAEDIGKDIRILIWVRSFRTDLKKTTSLFNIQESRSVWQGERAHEMEMVESQVWQDLSGKGRVHMKYNHSNIVRKASIQTWSISSCHVVLPLLTWQITNFISTGWNHKIFSSLIYLLSALYWSEAFIIACKS